MNTIIKQLKQIGKGSFSTVYKSSSDRVLIKSVDYCKECMSMGWGFDSSLFPTVKREDINLYSMKYYPKCTAPKQQLNKLSYGRYKTLRGLCIDWSVNKYDGFDNLYKAFKTIKDRTLRNALIEALDGLSNYGSDIRFEISPRNITYTKSGNLILLDVFFFANQLIQVRSNKVV